MQILHILFIVLHLLSVAGIVILLLLQGGKEPKKLPKGLIHSALTAMVAGLALVGIREVQHHQNAALFPLYNYGTIFGKLFFLLIILYIIIKNRKAPSISRGTWIVLLGLTVVNIGLAGSLK